MARAALTPQALKRNNYAVQAGDLAISFASDAVNGNKFASTGQEILLVKNTDTNPHTFTISSVADLLGRTGDIAAYSIPAGAIAAIELSAVSGWAQADGNIYLNASDATVVFAVLSK
jgi:hypothetical protein